MTNSELSLIAVVIVMVLLFGIWWLWWRLPKWQVSRLALKIRDPKARADVEDNFRKTVGQASLGVHRRLRPRWFASGWCRHEASVCEFGAAADTRIPASKSAGVTGR